MVRSTERALLPDQLVLAVGLRLLPQRLLQGVVEVLVRIVLGRVGRKVEQLDLVGVARWGMPIGADDVGSGGAQPAIASTLLVKNSAASLKLFELP